MYDGGKIIAGLAACLALAALPFWVDALAGRQPRPQPKIVTQEKRCVAERATMRSSHMALLNTWRDKLADRKLVQNLQREIHTFKGGARMAGLEGLGELSHAMETLLEHIAGSRLEATVAAVQALEEGCDNLNLFIEQLQSGRLPQAGEALARFEKKVKALRLPQTEPMGGVLPLALSVAADR